MLSRPVDIASNVSYTYFDAVIKGTELHVVASAGGANVHYKRYTAATGEQLNTDVQVVSGVAGITFINSATAVIVSSSTNQVDFVDTVNNIKTLGVTTNANTVYSNTYGPQVAGNTSTGVAIATRNSNNSVTKIVNGSCSVLSPSILSGNQASVVTVMQSSSGDTPNFLIGTNNGKIFEMDASGNVIKSITLPTTPNTGSAPTNETVTGIAHSPPYLLATSSFGTLYHYNYNTSTMLNRYPITFGGSNSPNIGSCLSNGSSGFAIMGQVANTSDMVLSGIFFDTLTPTFQSYVDMDNSSQVVKNIRIDANTKTVAVVYSGVSLPASIRTYLYSGSRKKTETTEIQDPPGARISGRIIRIRDDGIGRAVIEVDQTISAAEESLLCTEGKDYIEIAVNDAVDKWDIREFST